MADDLTQGGMMDGEDVTGGASDLEPNWLEIGRKLAATDKKQGMRPSEIGESYADWARERRIRQGHAATIVMESVKDDPDKIAQVLNTAKAFGALSGYVPAFSMVKQFHKEFESEVRRRKNAKILAETPLMALWMRNPDFASLAQDDLENLGWFGRAGNSLARGGGRVAQGFSQWRFEEAVSGLRHTETFEEGSWAFPNDTPESIAALQDKLNEKAVYWADKVDHFSKVGERYPKSLSARQFEDQANSGGEDAAWYEAFDSWLGAIGSNPGKFISWALETAGESTPQLAATAGVGIATRSPVLAAATSGVGSYATERFTSPAEFFRERGFDLSKSGDIEKIINDPKLMREAAQRGIIRGLVIGAFDALSVGIAGKAIAKNPFAEAAAQVMTQMVLGGSGEYLARVAAGQKIDWNEILAEAFAEIATTPVDMVAAGRRMGGMERAADTAGALKGWLGQMSQMAQASKLRGRAPDKFGEFVGAALKGGVRETLYVDAGKLNEYFQSQGLDPTEAIKGIDGVGLANFERALLTGGDITIPTSTYAAHIAGTDLDVWLQDNARLDPDGMSGAQAADYDARAQDLFQELVEEEAAARRAREGEASIEEQIHQEMTARLEGAGRVPDVARAEAAPIAAFYRTMSERAGISMQEMLERYPLPEVRGDLPLGIVEAQVDELTRLLALARSQTAARQKTDRRRSLLEFIDDLGGINDVGGELKARDAEIIKRGRGKKNLKLARGRDDGGQGVDEIARAVVEAGYLADHPQVQEYLNAALNGTLEPDIVGVLWEAIDSELRGRPSYAHAAGEDIQARADMDEVIADLEEYLARLGLNLDDPDADIRAAIESDQKARREGGGEYYQAGRNTGGRAATATINGDVVLEPVELENLTPIDGYKNAQSAVKKGTFENQSGDKVLISNKAVVKWFHGKENAIKRSLAPHFHKIFEHSVTYHKGEDGFSYAAGLVNLDGKQVGVRFAIKQVKGNPDRLYYVEGIEIFPEEGLPPIFHESLKDKSIIGLERGGDTRGLSVAQVVEAFNRYPVENRPLFQGRGNDGRRGSIVFGQDGAAIINLFRDADLSTLVHESGHFFLNVLQDMAWRGEVSAASELQAVKSWWRSNAGEVAKDANRADAQAGVEVGDVEAWLDHGTSGDAVKDAAIDIGAQEQFARGFEAYLMEGKAPSEGLRAAFETFRAWLISIYKRLASLNVKLNDEIRGVFDRMIASDEAIAAMGKDVDGVAGSVMADAASLGLSEEEYASLLKIRQQAQDEAQARLLEKTMEPLRRAREKWFKREKATVKAQVEEEINALPHYRVFEWLGNRRWLGDDSPDVSADLRLDKAQLIERYGAGILKTLPRGQFTLYRAKDGADIDMVAGLFGFKSGDEMVQALERMVPRKEAIEAQTDKVMRERHGDVLNDGTVEMQAGQAVHNDKKGQWLAAELKAGAQVAGVKVELSARGAREFATKQIAAMPVRDAVKSWVFLAAERRASREATQLAGVLAKQDLWQQAARRRLADKARSVATSEVTALEDAVEVAADVAADVMGGINAEIEAANISIEEYNETVAKFIKAKQSQLLNHALYSESVKASREFESLLRRAERLNKAINKIRSSRKRLGDAPIAGDYIEPIEAILENYGLRRITGRSLDKREVLQAYIAKMEEEGRANELGIADHVLEDARELDYESLSVEHLRGVADSLKNIEHMARMRGKLLMENKQRDFAQAKAVIIDGLERNLKQVDVAWIKSQGFTQRIKKGMRSYLAVVQNATHILRRIDGREDLGAVYELLKTPLDTASSNERMLRAKASRDFKKLYSVYSTVEQRQMGVERQYDELGGRSFSKWNLIAMALNMGNEGNLARLTNKQAKQRLSDREVNAVKRLLDKKDWDFVQSVWDYLETWKAKISERDKRLRGIEPEWVEALPVATPYGNYRGGYYPIKYDGQLGGSRRMVDEASDIFSQMTAGSYARATTRQGHLKARIGNGQQSLNLDISVMGKHVMEVIHDLEFNEPVVNSWRLLNNNDVEAAFLKANMKEAYDALKLWVQDVASGQIMSDSDAARLVNKLRGGFTISKLSFNAFTIVQQPLGLGQAAQMVGGKNLSAVLLEYGRNAPAMADEVLAKSKMMWERRDTFNKDVMDAVAQSNVANPKAGKVKDAIDDYVVPYGLLGLVAMQYYTVDVPTWIAAYRKGLSQFDGDDAKAVRYADMAISASQASGLFLDRAAIERGTLSASIRQNPFVLLMTVLGSYFFSKQNRVIEATQEFRSKPLTPQSIMEYAYSLTLLLWFEAALIQTIKWALQSGDDDEDESLAANIAFAGIENYLAGVPFVRDMVGASKGYDAGAYSAIINTAIKPFMRAADGKIDKPFAKSTINLIGTMTRLPSTQTNRVLDAVVRGLEEDEFSLMEAIFGRSRK